MKRFRLGPSCYAFVQQGDITKVAVDAIVNAANERMLGGLGVADQLVFATGVSNRLCPAAPIQNYPESVVYFARQILLARAFPRN